MAKKKYSYAEKKAYWVGVGMAIGKTQCKEDLDRIEKSGLEKSLNAGFGKEMGRKPPSIKLFSKKNNKANAVNRYVDRGRSQDDFAGNGGWF